MSAPPAAPLITTVVPTYRRPALLRRAIQSVLGQTFPDFQVCIYDDASGDDTEKVVSEFAAADGRVKYFRHPQNIGGMPNYIFGMSRVQTPFFSLLPDDDVMLPGFFENALGGFAKHPEAMLSALATLHADDEGKITAVPLLTWREGLYPPPSGLLAMLENDVPMMMGSLFRQEMLKQVGTFAAEAGLAADLDFQLRIAARWPIVVSHEPGAIFVHHRGSLSKTETLAVHWAFWETMASKLEQDKAIAPDVRSHLRAQIRRRFAAAYLGCCGLKYVADRQWDTAQSAATILRNGYHRPFSAFVLQSLARVGRAWPSVSGFFKALQQARQGLAQPADEIPPEYARYAGLLNS